MSKRTQQIPTPPALARWLVARRLSARRDEVLDDLAVLFEQDVETHGIGYARLRYWLEALNIGLLGIGETAERPSTTVSPMIYLHYLKIALRKAAHRKGYAFINLFGLVVGLASFMVIMLYVYDELSYDRFHADADRIHRVVYDEVGSGSERPRIAAPGALKNAMLRDIPEIEQATHLLPSNWGKALLSNENYAYYDDDFLYVDDSFLDVFSFQFIDGDAPSAFADPASVVLTESVAARFFDNTEALGQTLTFNQDRPLTVTGVIADVPAQSHIQFDFLVSTVAADRPNWETGWGQGHYHTYIKVLVMVALLNEKAVHLLGISEPVVGQQIVSPGWPPRTIIGVVKDFHFTSLHNEIKPFVFGFTPSANTAVIKLSGGDIKETLAQIEATWKKFVPDVPMDFYFLDAAIDQQYRAEQNFNVLFSVMTGLALIIACLGLFGLTAFTVEQRTREIGIRKVLGASVSQVVTLLSQDFVKLVLWANLLAWPLAYIAMNTWLSNFAYRIDMGIGIFVLTGVSVLLIAASTVSLQAIKAATANPVDSLRHE